MLTLGAYVCTCVGCMGDTQTSGTYNYHSSGTRSDSDLSDWETLRSCNCMQWSEIIMQYHLSHMHTHPVISLLPFIILLTVKI